MTIAIDEGYTVRNLADDVHALLVALDPALWKDERAVVARDAVTRIRTDAEALYAEWAQAPADGDEARLRDAVTDVVEPLPDPAAVGPTKRDWAVVYEQVWPRYEVLATLLKEDGERVKHVKPQNWSRSVVHVGVAIAVALAYELVLGPWTAVMAAAAWCAWAWTLEIARQRSPWVNELCMKAFGSIAREHERHRVNSATWLGTGLLILALTTSTPLAVLGLVAIGVGDPVAGFVGRRWGKTKLLRGRSLEGSSAFFLATLVASVGWLAAFHAELSAGVTVALAVVAAIVGTVAEMLSTRIDDNLAVTLATGWAVALAAAWLV